MALRDDGRVGEPDLPAWIGAATAAAVRLAAEAGAEVDEILEHDERPAVLRAHINRLQQASEPVEVATDLAGLLWAESEDVPLIETILAEPGTRAALEAVAEARRQAADRLARSTPVPEAAAPEAEPEPAPEPAPAAVPPAARAATVAPAPPPTVTTAAPAFDLRRVPPLGAVAAGAAAAALLLVGRRLRRA